LKLRGIPFELFTEKRLLRNQLQLNNETMVVGDHPTIAKVLKRIGFNSTTDCYPKSLEKYLGRKVWSTTIRKLYANNSFAEVTGLFVKPRSVAKLFTGFVINSDCDLLQLDRYAKDTELYCATLANWQSEYRVFVINATIVGIQLYAGDDNLKLDLSIVENAIQDFEQSMDKTAAYSIDFGVLDTGATTLIEWNDGYALGSYGLDKEIYTDLLIARWEEVLQKSAISLSEK
jgi:hypothetical protein